MAVQKPLVLVSGQMRQLASADTIAKASVGLGNVDDTADIDKPVSTLQQAALDAKAERSQTHLRKGLLGAGVDLNTIVDSGIYLQNQNANTTTTGAANYPANLAGTLEVVSEDANFIVQQYTIYNTAVTYRRIMYYSTASSTWTYQAWRRVVDSSSLSSDVRAAVLTGINTASANNIPIVATDNVITGFGKAQAQINSIETDLSGKEPGIAAGVATDYYKGDKTWADLFTDVRAATLTGLPATSNTAIAATDTVLAAMAKLQGQVAARQATIAAGTTAQYYRGDKTWQDLAGAVRASVLTGMVTTTKTPVVVTDNILTGMGKLQAQVSAVDMISGITQPLQTTTAHKTLTTADFGKVHANVYNSGPGWINFTLPAASGNFGKQLIFLALGSAQTRLVCAGTEKIDGLATRRMAVGETAVLMSDGSNWTKIGGITIPMSCRMYSGRNYSMPQEAWNQLVMEMLWSTTTAGKDQFSGWSLVAPRAGTYFLNGGVTIVNSPGTITYANYMQFRLNGAGLYQVVFGRDVPDYETEHFVIKDKTYLAEDTAITLWHYHSSSAVRNIQGQYADTTYLEMTEIPAW